MFKQYIFFLLFQARCIFLKKMTKYQTLIIFLLSFLYIRLSIIIKTKTLSISFCIPISLLTQRHQCSYLLVIKIKDAFSISQVTKCTVFKKTQWSKIDLRMMIICHWRWEFICVLVIWPRLTHDNDVFALLS